MKNIVSLLSDEELKSLKERRYKKGETLFFENSECTQIGIVMIGEIRIISYLKNGQEVLYNSLTGGQMFGNNLIFSSDPFYRGDVMAYKDSVIYLISKKQLLTLLKTNSMFLEAYLNSQSDFGKELNFQIKLLTFKNAEDRLMYFLKMKKNSYTYSTITDLAKSLYLTREVLSRLIHKLEKENAIKIANKTITKTN